MVDARRLNHNHNNNHDDHERAWCAGTWLVTINKFSRNAYLEILCYLLEVCNCGSRAEAVLDLFVVDVDVGGDRGQAHNPARVAQLRKKGLTHLPGRHHQHSAPFFSVRGMREGERRSNLNGASKVDIDRLLRMLQIVLLFEIEIDSRIIDQHRYFRHLFLHFGTKRADAVALRNVELGIQDLLVAMLRFQCEVLALARCREQLERPHVRPCQNGFANGASNASVLQCIMMSKGVNLGHL